MATPNITPNANNEGRLGKGGLQWSEVHSQNIFKNGQEVATLESPTFTGSVAVPVPAGGDNTTKPAPTSWVRTMLAGWHKIVGAQVDGNLVEYDSAGVGLRDSGYTIAQLLALANATGVLPANQVEDSGVFANSTIDEDIDELNDLIIALTAVVAGKAASSHTHTEADLTISNPSTFLTSQLGAGAVGKLIFEAVTASAVRALIGSGATGDSLFQAANAAAARGTLGAGATGDTLFTAGSASAARTALGAGATGDSLFAAATASAARIILGSGTTGDALFLAANAAAARTTLGAGATGDSLFAAATAAAARIILGSTTVGDALFIAASAAAARTALGSTATGDALFIAASAAAARTTLGSTAVGDALFIAASAAAARTAADAAQAADSIGYCFAAVTSPAATVIASPSTFYTAEATTFATVEDINFSVPDATEVGLQYDGTVTKKFLVAAKVTVTCGSTNQLMALRIGKNGTSIATTEMRDYYVKTATNEMNINTQAIIELATNDTVELMISNETAANNITCEHATLLLTPIN